MYRSSTLPIARSEAHFIDAWIIVDKAINGLIQEKRMSFLTEESENKFREKMRAGINDLTLCRSNSEVNQAGSIENFLLSKHKEFTQSKLIVVLETHRLELYAPEGISEQDKEELPFAMDF